MSSGGNTHLLVLTRPDDPVGPWLVEGLRDRGHETALHLSTDDLLDAMWSHTLGEDGVGFEARFPDGLVLTDRTISGVINRVGYIGIDRLGSMAEPDREYVMHEANAFFLSWLASIQAPVFNPPSPRGVAGAWRTPSEWAHLAARAGLAHRPVSSTDPEPPPTWSSGPTAITVGAEIVDDGLDEPTREAAIALAALAETPMLGMEFSPSSGGFVLTSVTPYPKLEVAGDAMLDAFAYAFGRAA